MYRIALCEDAPADRDRIDNYLRQIFDELKRSYTLQCFATAEDFFCAAGPHMFEMVIFDIEMGQMDGIKASKILRAGDKSVVIAFTSSHPEYVFSSFSAEPLNYLLKPVRYPDLYDLVSASVHRIDEARRTMFGFEMKGVLYGVPVKDICYFESNARVVRLVTDSGDYSFYGKLDDVAADPNLASFIRCHKSYLVNPLFVAEVTGTAVKIASGDLIPISRGNAKKVKAEFADFLNGCVS